MIYIPSLTSLPSEIQVACNTTLSDGFYIDIYEVSDFLIENSSYELDGVPSELSNPATMDATEAQNWCAM